MWLFLSIISLFFTGIATFLIKKGMNRENLYFANALVNSIVLTGFAVVSLIGGAFKQVGEISLTSWLCTVVSGSILALSWALYFKGLQGGNISLFLGIQSLSIIFSMILCYFFIGENIGFWMICGSAFILTGILLMIDYKELKNIQENKWIIYSLLSALLSSVAYVVVKWDKEQTDTNLLSFFRYCIVALFLWGLMWKKKDNINSYSLKKGTFKYIAVGGVLSSAGHILVYKALVLGKAMVVLTFYRMGMIVSVVLSKLFGDEKLTPRQWTGFTVLVIGISLYALE